jgi:hypothetical protein
MSRPFKSSRFDNEPIDATGATDARAHRSNAGEWNNQIFFFLFSLLIFISLFNNISEITSGTQTGAAAAFGITFGSANNPNNI